MSTGTYGPVQQGTVKERPNGARFIFITPQNGDDVISLPSDYGPRGPPPAGTQVQFQMYTDPVRKRSSARNICPVGQVYEEPVDKPVFTSFVERWKLGEDATRLLRNVHPKAQEEVMKNFKPRNAEGQACTNLESLGVESVDGKLILFTKSIQKAQRLNGGQQGHGMSSWKGGGKGGWDDAWNTVAAWAVTQLASEMFQGKGKGGFGNNGGNSWGNNGGNAWGNNGGNAWGKGCGKGWRSSPY
eukprot:TRINITY_DN5515_c0_g1_i1.p1 TRINITY_DN5515_c0_g1~~TRINITY_DN5515_c0_g1_i1.p1  ORF type:complete len:243 (+),score=62.33 TRINITY_DN5515_c0_g1_i1:107-835(+)